MKRTEIQNLASSIEDELIRMFDYDTRRSVVRLESGHYSVEVFYDSLSGELDVGIWEIYPIWSFLICPNQ